MSRVDAADYLDGATVWVAAPTYAVCRTDDPPADAFAVVRDESETTAVVPESHPAVAAAEAATGGWRRLTFDLELPFDLVGFLAAVASALSEADVAVFVVSAYSTDHVLVDEADLDAALAELDGLGCAVPDRP
ncbi:ACT domain-containing protein [Haloarcula litorea]|uniref:ACT domain-containing protein n=1 Tax=Haloarcula litorea TaxID=3032579 RepID=UPI0023E827AB|nr:ACT domain-containing protein [Halomicroarcula sp. GDY20]